MKITQPETDESKADPTDVNYQSLLWQVLDAALVLEKVHTELKAVREHVTGDTETARLGIIQERITEVRTVFGQVGARRKPRPTAHGSAGGNRRSRSSASRPAAGRWRCSRT